MKVSVTVFLKKIIFSMAALFCVHSCKMFDGDSFNADMHEFFKDYTETAAIYNSYANDSYRTDNSGRICYDCTSDKTYIFIMRNPQRYSLTFGYNFTSGAATAAYNKVKNENIAAGITDSAPIKFYQDRIDTSRVTMKISKDLIEELDGGGNLSGEITLLEPMSNRSFESFSLDIYANSPPPAVQSPMFQLSTASNPTYYICFCIPEITQDAMKIHSKDTRTIRVNDELRYFDGGKVYKSYSNGIYSDEDTLYEYGSVSVLPLVEDGYKFDDAICPPGFSRIYYNSGVVPPGGNEVVTYTMTVIDDAGLSTTTTVSNQAKQLCKPNLPSQKISVDENTGLADAVFTHNGLCTDTEHSECGEVTINYVFKEINGEKVFSRKTSDTLIGAKVTSGHQITVPLPKGKYEVQAWASKNYYVSSDFSEIPAANPISVQRMPTYYVSETGEDENTGAISSPLRTVQCAIDEYIDSVQKGYYDKDDGVLIYVVSDLTIPSDFDLASNNNAFINIPDDFDGKMDIIGNGGKWTIDGQASQTCNIANVGSGEVNISSLGFTNAKATALLVRSGKVSLTNSSFTSNTTTASDTGAALQINSGSEVSMYGCEISGNSGKNFGAVVNNGTLTLKGKNIITGSTKEDGLTKANLYTTTVINIDGDITGSSIGVSMDKNPTKTENVVLTHGYDYGTTNTKVPGSIFITETNYGITDDGGEAVFALSCGSVQIANHSLSISYSIPANQDRTVILKVADGGNEVNCTFKLFKVTYSGDEVSEDYWTPYLSDGKVVFENSAVGGTYELYVVFEYDGYTYDATLPILINSFI